MRDIIIAGNWKMNKNYDEALELTKKITSENSTHQNIQTVLGVPFPFLKAVSQACQSQPNVHVGAQNLYPKDEGAYTGEVSGPMILSCGASYVILGHSERRDYFQEDDEFINQKVRYAIRTGLRPIVCVGESLETREKGEHVDFVLDQLRVCLKDIEQSQAGAIVIAYEPIWAIGTGKTAEPEQAQEMHASIREFLKGELGSLALEIPILYGGSMKPKNADSLLQCDDIDGGLIGGASLEADSFLEIRKIVERML